MTREELQVFGIRGLATAADYLELLKAFGVRCKMCVFQADGVVVLRVSRETALLVDWLVQPWKSAGTSLNVCGDLAWWECRWEPR